MALQGGALLLEGAEAEATVGTACPGDSVVGVIRVGAGLAAVQLLHVLAQAGVEVVDIVLVGVVKGAAVAIQGAAGVADGFGPVVAGVVGIHAGSAVQNGADGLVVTHGGIGVDHVASDGRDAVPAVLRDPEQQESGLLIADIAVEGLRGHDGVDIQLVRTVQGGPPVLGGVVVVRPLGRKGGGNQGQHDGHDQQESRQPSGDIGDIVVVFQIAPPKFLEEIRKVPGTLCPKGLLLQFRLLLRLLFLPLVQQGYDLVLHLTGSDLLAKILVEFVGADDHIINLLFLFA